MAGYGFQHQNRNETVISRSERDVVALGIVFTAIIMFVGTGSSVVTRAVRHVLFGESSVDILLTNALLLNIALIVFGWRRYVDLTREVAARRVAEAAALRLADTDPLTGLQNRRSFDVTLKTAPQAGGSLALILIDLDKFKHANDLHGHHGGDTVLIEIARRTAAILPQDAALARLGGDEFAALVSFAPDADTPGLADRIAAQIGAAIATPIKCGETMILITASIGVACQTAGPVENDGGFGIDLMRRADVAMYQAKKLGRSRHCLFDPAMEAAMFERCRLEQAIRRGIQRGEFRPHYEKQIDLTCGTITGLEMLARWDSAEFGAIGPDVFVPIAEDIGLMPELSEALIRQALVDASEWAPHLILAINISPVQLRDPLFAQRLLKLLLEGGMPPNRLAVEITEQCLAENLTLVQSLITSLRNQGVRISLDDFGHSTSSLAYLRTLPFDRIKIDRNFIAGLGQSRDSAAVVEAISAMGRDMDLAITAEGIESPEILAELRKFGGFQGQGHVYGKPLSASQLRHELTALDLLAVWPDVPPTSGDRHRA